jgi:leucyl/phenylalanyl-tRNA--protein transferase
MPSILRSGWWPPARYRRIVPVEPPPTPWVFPDPRDAEDDLVGIGADLAPGTLLAAYRHGLFPMPEHGVRPPMHWFSPVDRGIVPLDGLKVSRSLRRACRDFELRVDTAFDDVVAACADPARDAGWITSDIAAAYAELHRLGWAHSVEAWRDGELAGGLYGVGIGGLFAGESMFHRARDASKVALVGLVELLTDDGHPDRLLDVQWVTPHLASLGAVEVPRAAYLRLLKRALDVPAPAAWKGVTPAPTPTAGPAPPTQEDR